MSIIDAVILLMVFATALAWGEYQTRRIAGRGTQRRVAAPAYVRARAVRPRRPM